MKTIAIIPSGGKGVRVGGDIPKQYIKLQGKEIIAHTIQVFQSCDLIDEIIIAAQPEYFGLLEKIKSTYNFSKIRGMVEGGDSRQDSVYNALKSISPEQDLFITVHDAARPLIAPEIISEGIKQAVECGSSVTAIPAKDTILYGTEWVDGYIDRNSVFYVQTPQTSKYDILIKSFEKANESGFQGTDESMLVRNAGFKVKVVEGSTLNFKITTKDDLIIADNILSNG
ncbi:MAG: 2-C-methyl-D-erythritol 4-phosphate cytidylyltransferase [Bacteroidetes bacterium]|nr:2-C-methyl-D-erythritol 4-phosphate cytidylyltransferase [Bacteroidota bacterium]